MVCSSAQSSDANPTRLRTSTLRRRPSGLQILPEAWQIRPSDLNFFFGQIRAGCSASAACLRHLCRRPSRLCHQAPFNLAKTLGDRRIHHGIKLGWLVHDRVDLNGVQSFSSVGSNGIRLCLPVLGGRKFHGFSDIEVGEAQDLDFSSSPPKFHSKPGQVWAEPFSFSSSSHVSSCKRCFR